MRFATLTVLAAASSLAAAQLLDQLPQCARSCYTNNQGNCNPIDIKCVCANSTLIEGLSCCVSQNCNPDEQKTTINFASGLCQGEGVAVPTSAGCAPSSKSSPTQSGIQSGLQSDSPSSSPTSSSTGAAAIHTGIGIGLGIGMAGLLAAL